MPKYTKTIPVTINFDDKLCSKKCQFLAKDEDDCFPEVYRYYCSLYSFRVEFDDIDNTSERCQMCINEFGTAEDLLVIESNK